MPPTHDALTPGHEPRRSNLADLDVPPYHEWEVIRGRRGFASFGQSPGNHTLGELALPVGLTTQQLLAAAQGDELDQARRALARPATLDCVLVAQTPTELMGISVDTGKKVAVP